MKLKQIKKGNKPTSSKSANCLKIATEIKVSDNKKIVIKTTISSN